MPPTGFAGSPSRGETGIDGIDGDVGWKGCPVGPGKTDLCPGVRGIVPSTLEERALGATEEVECASLEGYAGERNIF